MVRRLVSAGRLRRAGAGSDRRAQSDGTNGQFRSGGTWRGQTRTARRIVPMYRSVLRALSRGQPREIGDQQRDVESWHPASAISIPSNEPMIRPSRVAVGLALVVSCAALGAQSDKQRGE